MYCLIIHVLRPIFETTDRSKNVLCWEPITIILGRYNFGPYCSMKLIFNSACFLKICLQSKKIIHDIKLDCFKLCNLHLKHSLIRLFLINYKENSVLKLCNDIYVCVVKLASRQLVSVFNMLKISALK
jgi:hypothetical protein